jgi:hypothetical protein
LPPSLLLGRSADRLLAVQLQALEDAVPLLVAFEAIKPFLLVSLAVLRVKSSRDGIIVKSASVWGKFGHGLPVHLRDHDLDQTLNPRRVANV